ncbi:MAG TPA: hypothetical protein VF510_20590, partial [Ktedonobacterales bacterium]
QKNGAYHLQLVGSIDPVIKALARHSIRRLAVEEAPLEEIFLKFYTAGTVGQPERAAPLPTSTTQEGRPS